MYIEITQRCNMSCEHCCMSATAEGEDMTFEVFKACLEYDPENVSIGGGEPTLHPDFGNFLLYALGKSDYVWMATNGSQTEISLTLAVMARRGILGVALSQDDYHDPIDWEVIEAFQDGLKEPRSFAVDDDDRREIRNVTSREINSGRCDFGEEGCACPGIICNVNGDIRPCGCEDAPVYGNVLRPEEIEIPSNYEYDCYKNLEEEEDTV